MALESLKNKLSEQAIKEGNLEITVTDDNPESGQMLECFTVKFTGVEQAGKYDYIKSPTSWTYVIEVFAESENRSPRLTATGCRDLEKKEG